jgi:hypothetical protein
MPFGTLLVMQVDPEQDPICVQGLPSSQAYALKPNQGADAQVQSEGQLLGFSPAPVWQMPSPQTPVGQSCGQTTVFSFSPQIPLPQVAVLQSELQFATVSKGSQTKSKQNVKNAHRENSEVLVVSVPREPWEAVAV